MSAGWHERFRWMKLAAGLLAVLFFLLMVVLPALTAVLNLTGGRTPPSINRWLPSLEPIYAWLLVIFSAVWITFLGGCIASFLNVVAWRLPRGESLLGRSHCPKCNTGLSLRENLPIYGWLSCGGKCRYCQEPIAARYVIVELILGFVFLVVCTAEIGLGGWSLPRSLLDLSNRHSSTQILDLNLVVWSASHCTLLSLLFVFALVRLENEVVPKSIFWFGILVGVAFLIGIPTLRLSHGLGLAWLTGEFTSPYLFVGQVAMGIAVGWAGGLSWQMVARPTGAGSGDGVSPFEPVYCAVLAGLFAGALSAVQITLLAAVVALILNWFARSQSRTRISTSASYFCATTVYFLIWRWTSWG